MLVIALVLGALLGAAWSESFFGAAVGALLAWLLVRAQRQDKKVAGLERSLQDLRRGGIETAPATESAAAAATPTVTPLGVGEALPAAPGRQVSRPGTGTGTAFPSAEIEPSDATAARPAATEPPAAMPPAPPAAPPALAPATPAPPRSDSLAPIKGWLFGGNTIVKLGVAILFIGLAFLAKFASEHVQLPVELRLALIGAAAIVLLAFGWRLRHRRAGYAQVLQGAAVAALYLTLFVAFRYVHVLSAVPVFVLMVAVAALAAALAVLQDARALAVIGAIGGFATPLLVSTGGGNHVALFSYYLVLDLGIAAVAWFKTWRSLNLIGFIATFGVGSAWGLLDYQAARYASSQTFLIAFFLVFNAILLLPARRRGTQAGEPAGSTSEPTAGSAGREAAWVNGSLLFGLPTIAFALQLGLVRHWPFGSAVSALVLAAFYVLLAVTMSRSGKRREEMRVVFEASLAIAVIFLTLVIPFALDARSTAGAWALEGAGLVWLGLRQSRRLARAFGYALILLAAPTLLHAFDHHGAPQVVFNAYLFNGLMVVAGSLLAAMR